MLRFDEMRFQAISLKRLVSMLAKKQPLMLLKQMDLKQGGVILTSFVSKVFEVCESSGHFWKRGNAS